MFNLTFVDITQFAAEPLRTGVQRVLIKMIEHLPKDRIIPFRVVDARHVAILDPTIFQCCTAFFQKSQPSVRERAAARYSLHLTLSIEESLIRLIARRPLAIIQGDRFFRRVRRILNLESFVNIERSRFYISCPSKHRHKIYHLIHDFLPFEAPEAFPQLNWRYAADYLTLFEAYSVAGGYLVSTQEMAQKVCAYFGRREEDVQLVHFGGDITGEAVMPGPKRRIRRVVMLGTIEPRKYPLVVARALDELATRQPDVECMLIGSWGWVEPDTREEIETILRGGRVVHLTGVGDIALARLLADTAVAIYVSSSEGFGLPVIEFARLGIPVVTNQAVPSSALVSDGAIVLDEVTQPALFAAVTAQLERGRRSPYYKWTWADCGREIMSGKSVSEATIETIDLVNDLACWRISVQLMREMRQKKLDWEALKIEVREILFSEVGRSFGVLRGPMDKAQITHVQDLVENVSEVVSDNRNLVYWADLLAARPLLVEVMRSVLSVSYLDGLMRAYFAFVGRPIDTRAASEAVRFSSPIRRLERITELINSDEALNFLGNETVAALRSVLSAMNPVLNKTFSEAFDLFSLLESLGMPPPSLEDVCTAEKLLAGSADRLELLLYFATHRKACGDEVDLFLDAIAQLVLERGPRSQATTEVTAPRPLMTDAETGTEAQPGKRVKRRNRAPAESHATDTEPARASPIRELHLSSSCFGDGWYAVEHYGPHSFRWMGRKGVIRNPEMIRSVEKLILHVRYVYGGSEPKLVCESGFDAAMLDLQRLEAQGSWRVSLSNKTGPVRVEMVHLASMIVGCPARDEGSPDQRELSICIDTVTFVYAKPEAAQLAVQMEQNSNDCERDLGGRKIVGFIKESVHSVETAWRASG